MYTVLIVDDSNVTRRTVTAQLERHGFRARAAESTSQARLQLAGGSIDLIILDLGIPDAPGITLLRELRANRAFRSLPVIVLTGSGHDRDRVEARSAGATDFLTKPVSTSELLQTVNGALNITGYAEPVTGSYEAWGPRLK